MPKDSQATLAVKEEETPLQVWSDNFLANWFFTWVGPIITAGRTKKLKDLSFRLRKGESARTNVDSLDAAWRKELAQHKENASILRALKATFGTEYMAIAGYKVAWTFFTWAGAWYLLLQVLIFLSSSQPIFNGYMYAMALGLAGLLSSIAMHQQYSECNRVGIKVKAAIMGLIYRKSLRLSRVKGGAGEVINILASDVGKINDAICNFHFLWAAFMEVGLILGLSFYQIGVSAWPAVGFVLLLLPVQMWLGHRANVISKKQTVKTTERVHLMSELLTAIKLIKFYAWETPFAEKIESIRLQESMYMYESLMNKVWNYAIVFAIPVLVALTCLAMYVALGNRLTASVSFTTLSVFNTLRYPFFMLPVAVKSTVGALTSLEKINEFLLLEEVIELCPTPAPKGCDLAFEMDDCDFKWDGTEGDKPTIHNISLKIKKGDKVGIVGDVGCGKSSVLAALLGQIRQVKGETVKMYGTTAYMSQEAWLLNMTLRENVLFGKSMDPARYKETIRVAGLQRDLTLLIAGDQTEIAERGANLSGGQRQRVSLARSIYYDADIILLDDPLSAVDQHVGRHIFEECFMGYLKEKTVVVAINQLQYLSQLDYIVFVQDGTIYSQGTYAELMKTSERFATLVNTHVDDGGEIEDDIGAVAMNVKDFDPIKISEETNASKGPGPSESEIIALNSLSVMSRNQLSVRNAKSINESTIRSIIELGHSTRIHGAEKSHDVAKVMLQNELSQYSAKHVLASQIEVESDEDAIKRGRLVQDDESTKTAGSADFIAYFRIGRGGIPMTFAVFISFVLVHGLRIAGDFWLRLWVPKVGGYSDAVYVGVYGAFTIAFALGALLRGLFFSIVTTEKAKLLHNELFQAIIHAPMGFFDTTPVARIIACFSKHLLHVDDIMLDAAMQALQYFPLGLGALILSAVLIDWNWAPCIGLCAIGYVFIRYTTPADISTKSLEAITKPPVYSHLTATLEGLLSIRSYHAEERFDTLNLLKLDKNHEAQFAMQSVKSFQALYLDVLSSLVIFFSALLIVQQRDTIVPSNAGLALSNALQMLVFVQWTVRQWGDVETQMSSVGQLVYYGKTAPEAPFEIPERKPAASWPEHGLITFKNIELKYQKFGVSVLKNVSLKIYPKEKIGIVGRTGSGKSTLLVSLLRIVEPVSGTITIDGLDVSKIGLHDLRNKIAIIPQEPVMFVGTIRSNLDPFRKSSDEEIWKALDAVFLGEKLRQSPSKLETPVSENGKSVSQGQRQLLCIARAILSKAKVLVLDEATASLDAQTDYMIQEAIKQNFGELTMLTIAHRLNTIIESDRVLVMDGGCLVEFDEPIKLLQNKSGIFYSLVDQTGPAASVKLIETAQKAHDDRVASGYSFPQDQPDTDDRTKPLNIAEIAAGKM
ncbi:Multidrug resistance-associated protein 4 [Kappamyces sp. JEL0680]|nr:Multidrug resistance-associated protein 4 [Kappamyces sp. JEL0680]